MTTKPSRYFWNGYEYRKRPTKPFVPNPKVLAYINEHRDTPIEVIKKIMMKLKRLREE